MITGQTGTDPILRGAADFDLELLESRTLDGSIQELIYRPTCMSVGGDRDFGDSSEPALSTGRAWLKHRPSGHGSPCTQSRLRDHAITRL